MPYKNKEDAIKNRKAYYQKNKDKIAASDKKYRETHKNEISEYDKAYYQENKNDKLQYADQYYQENKEELSERHKQYRDANKESLREYQKEYNKIRRKNDPAYALRRDLSTIIRRITKSNNGSKYGKSILRFLPYSMQELKDHLEKQFEPWMTWENHGKYDPKSWNDANQTTWAWQIDHIIPQSNLPYASMEEDNFKKCWALDNLRPLSAKINHSDGVGRIRHK